MEEEDHFEFIDYTTASPWERFITQIEDCLTTWGLVDKSLGVFDPKELLPPKEALLGGMDPALVLEDDANYNPHTPLNKKQSASDNTSTNTQTSSSGAHPVYQYQEILTLDDASYAFSYQYHPARAKVAAGTERIDLDFLPVNLDGISHHNLHRWTSLTHILVLSPVTISDIFVSSISSASSAMIDISSAKLLLSSFAIAFQNTGCNIPVFVPTGQPWNMTFTGLSLQPQRPLEDEGGLQQQRQQHLHQGSGMGEAEGEDDQAIEVRFNTILVPYPPIQYSYLSGLTDFFIERMGVDESIEVSAAAMGQHRPGMKYNDTVKEHIHASALFSYDMLNWYDEDWRRWRAPETALELQHSPSQSTSVLAPARPENSDQLDARAALSGLPIPVLPFGPVEDPLRSMRLLARFASAPCTLYQESGNYTDMDASLANIWIVSANFKPDDHGMLSGILEDAISSWNSESISSSASKKDGQDPRTLRETTYESLLDTGARLLQGTITMVDAVDVENIVQALFEPHSRPIRKSIAKDAKAHTLNESGGAKSIRLIPACELGLHFRQTPTVPYNSFLWKMLQYLLDVVSPSSDITYATSIMGFMRVLWSEVLKQFYTHWETSKLVPWVDMYSAVPGMEDNGSGDAEKKGPMSINLRYSLIHQKLTMLNCCIARQIDYNKKAANRPIHTVSARSKQPPDSTMASQDPPLLASSPPGSTSSTGEQPPESNYGAQFQSLLHGLSENIPRPKSADAVARRLLDSVARRTQRSSVQVSDLASSFLTSSIDEGSIVENPSSGALSKADDDEYVNDSLERLSRQGVRVVGEIEDDDGDNDDNDDDDVYYEYGEGPDSGSLDSGRRGSTYSQRSPEGRLQQQLSESFVQLKYSSSAESQSSTFARTHSNSPVLMDDVDSINVRQTQPNRQISKRSRRELADDTTSEGGCEQLRDLKLLRTGTPLMVPRVQEPGYMTEDMIRQQEEIFEHLGPSSDAAKMRARLQSSQLLSDMEAFKAANPGCILEDFIRWHSPRDWVADSGQMSLRMTESGNYWQELWSSAKRIPADRQIPLFNHNQEAAKALHFLDNIGREELFEQLFPTMCLIAYDTLVSHPVATHIRQVSEALMELAQELTDFEWHELPAWTSSLSAEDGEQEGEHGGSGRSKSSAGEASLCLNALLDKFRATELLMGRAIGLISKLPNQYGLVERLLEDSESIVEDGPERASVLDLFSIGGGSTAMMIQQSSFPKPTTREFVLETFDPSVLVHGFGRESMATAAADTVTGWHSRPLQRRMYACFKESEVRIVEAVAKDGMFM